MRKTFLNNNLQTQISTNQLSANRLKQLAREEDLAMLAKAGEVMLEEHQEWREKDKGQKELYRRTWVQQKDVKE